MCIFELEYRTVNYLWAFLHNSQCATFNGIKNTIQSKLLLNSEGLILFYSMNLSKRCHKDSNTLSEKRQHYSRNQIRFYRVVHSKGNISSKY